MNRWFFIFLVFLTLATTDSNAQRLDMKFFDPISGKSLSSTFATCIIQDTVGFIWVGTRDGLNVFDGADVTYYLEDLIDSTSLVNDQILDLYLDQKGDVWVATNRGISLYNREKDNFITIVDENNYRGLQSPNVNKIRENREGDICIASGNTIYRYDRPGEKFFPVVKIENGEILEMLFTDDGGIWIAGAREGGLNFFNTRKDSLTNYSQLAASEFYGVSDVRDMAIYHEKLWIATYGSGVYSLDLSTGEFKQYQSEGPYDVFSTFIYVDNDDRLWTCDLTGLKLYDEDLDIFYGYYSEEGESNNLKENANAIFQDCQGNYWTLHSPGGLSQRIVPRSMHLYNVNPEWYWHTSENNITSFSVDGQGNWWIGNHHNGLDIFEWSKGEITRFNFSESDPYSLGKGSTFAIFNDSQNTMWIGSNLGGLQYFNPSDSNFHSYIHYPEDPTSIANNDVRSISEDVDSNLWVVVHGKGVDKFDRKEQEFVHFNEKNANLSNNWTFQVFIDSKENIWVATAWGLNKLVKGDNEFKNYLKDAEDEHSIPDNVVNYISEDSQGQIWIATSKGICKYDWESDNFTRYNLAFKDDNVCAIQEDALGTLWVSTQKGISSFNPKENTVKNFDSRDGVQNGEFNRAASYKDADGVIFFGGVNGLNYFKPNELYYNGKKPQVVISKLTLFNNEVHPNDATGILTNSISTSEAIELDHDQNMVGFKYVALNLINPEKNSYKYMLEGLDKSWIVADNKQEAVYTNLDPGEYTFRVIASNNDDVWNKKGASLAIIIYPPWWMTWWFKVIIVLGAAFLVVLVFYVRTARLRNQKLVLERKVEDRTRKLNGKNLLLKQQTNDLNEINTLLEEKTQQIEEQTEVLQSYAGDLEKKNEELERLNVTKDKLFSIVAHDLKNPFHAILSLSNMFHSKFDKLTDEDKVKIAGYINSSGKTVYNLLENLLKWARSQSNQIVFRPTDLEIHKVLEENMHLLAENARDKEIKTQLSKKTKLMVHGDSDMLNTVIRNLLNNAIKFTERKGTVAIHIEEEGGYARVSITDNGIGMREELLKDLFTIDKQNSREGTDGEKGSALGLVLCKDFVERNGGEILVKSKEGKGSTFSFTIPLSIDQLEQ